MSIRRLPPACGAALAAAVLAALLALPAAVHAADTLGLWFDTAYSQNEDTGTALPYMGELYLVLHEPSATSVGGWECKVATDGPATFLGWDLEGLAVNFETPPSFTVGLGAPLPPDTDVLLATGQFMVTELRPVAWSLVPTYHASIPDHMAYIPFEDPNLLLPLGTATGTPEVAWFNRALPICTLSAPALDFASQPIGVETLRNLTVTNEGGGTVWVDARIDPACDGFRVVSGGGLTGLTAGQWHTVTVGFSPTAPVGYTCELDLGTACGPVPVAGIGREALISGVVSPNPVDFGELVTGVTASRVVTVTNTGEVTLELQVQPGAGCEAFSFETPLLIVAPGTWAPLAVHFTPPAVGSYACQVDLHPFLATLELSGSARAPLTGWNVSPVAVDFGEIGLGTGLVPRPVTVYNTGEAPQALDLALDDPDGVFSIEAPAESQPVVPPGTAVVVSVGFTPATLGDHAGVLHLGGGAPDVSLAGSVSEPAPGCDVPAVTLAFGDVAVGNQATRSLRVNNTGNTVLTFAPSIDCPEFTVTSAPESIEPGSFGWFTVAFGPTAEGQVDCVLSLGPDVCAQVALSGNGIGGGWGGDPSLVAVSFAPDFVLPEYGASDVPVDAYVMMVNPAYDLGVWAWELKLTFDEGLLLLSADLMGQSLNFLTPPEFVVGLAAPLPDAPIVTLAHLSLIAITAGTHTIAVGPVHVPSIAGEMAWAYNDNYDLAPMYPITGQPVVATLDYTGGVALEAPAPEARLVDGRVELTWPVPTDGADGCHVYRTAAGRETRLTTRPLRPSGTRYAYTDDPAGLPAGAAVGYSYAIVRGTIEVARSPQATVELPAADALATRLLANRPNPFNPETEIHFQMAKAGPVRIAVYDVTGRRVAVLEDGERTAGRHQVTWRGRDAAGRVVPSGAYYVSLETATVRDTRKVMLLK